MSPLHLVEDQAELVDRIYEAALREGGWSETLEDLAGALGGITALHRYDLVRGCGDALSSARFPSEAAVAYQNHYSRVNPWMRESRRRFDDGELVISSEIYPDDSLVRTEFYDDFLRRNDLFYSMGGVLLREEDSVVTLTTLRSQRCGLYREEERRAFRALIPHLKRALLLSRRLGAASAGRAVAFELLDRLPYGVALLDGSGRIRSTNRAARTILDSRDGLTVRDEQLVAETSNDTARLRSLITGSARATDRVGAPGGSLVLQRPSGKASYVLLVSPLRAPDASIHQGARVIVFVSDPEKATAPPDATLARLYKLTPAEQRLASAMAQGLSLREAAEQFRVSLNTVRTQLQGLFAKTNTRRQSDFVRLVLSLPPSPSLADP